MEWNKEAIERHERMGIPPSVSPLARKQAEKIARKKGLSQVTVKEVEEAEESYATYFGREKAQEMKNLLEGKEPVPQMVEELFFDSSEKLYDIKVCPVKYGSQSKEVADGITGIFRGVQEIFEKEQIEETIAGLSRAPLTQQSRFTVVIAGCSNCCEPPFFKDLGVVGQHVPMVTDADCLHCNKCKRVCYEDAITLNENGPGINRALCINCEFCAKSCPNEKIVIEKRGYKVIAGGREYRHPAVAVTVKAFTGQEGVLTAVKNLVALLKKGNEGDTLKSLIEKYGIDLSQ
jgi:anaerobic sulfite reductase subunit C